MTRGTWLVTRTQYMMVDASDEEGAISEYHLGRGIVTRTDIKADPRYTGVVTNDPPPRFPGYTLCAVCRGDHWTRDHDRAYE